MLLCMSDELLAIARAALLGANATQAELVRRTGLGHSTVRRVLGKAPGAVASDNLSSCLAAYGIEMRTIKKRQAGG